MLTDADLATLTTLTALPTIAGHEDRVIVFVRAWAADRPGIAVAADPAGNLVLGVPGVEPSLLVTAHMDHPGFVVTGTPADGVQPVEFRGGVREPYFESATLHFFEGDEVVSAELVAFDHGSSTGGIRAERSLAEGALGRWAFADDELGIRDGVLHAPGCDDLAGVAAALSMLDRTRSDPSAQHVGVLLTRAEEVGFVGAIAACENGTIRTGTRVVCLETSRAFDWAPVGAGPVVRVGDRVSVFTPELTGAIAAVAEALDRPTQRKLMDGGACEATAFAAYGHAATCVCLPLGNYHNQGDLDRVEVGGGVAEPAPEFIALDDHAGLVELLVAVAKDSGQGTPPLRDRLRARYEEQRHLLDPSG